MPDAQAQLSDGDRRLDELFADYLEAAERGELLDAQSFVARHPDLIDYAATDEGIGRLAAPIRGIVSTSPFSPVEGEVLASGTSIGEYEVLQELGRDRQGIVYRARHLRYRRDVVALKVLLAGHRATEKEVQRFVMEVDNQATLDHSNIVAIKGGGEHEGRLYFTMRLIEGCTLAERVASQRLTPKEAAHLTVKISRAMHHAHERGILHRDLKPSNILLDAAGEPFVADFGLSKRVETQEPLNTGYMVGAAPFVAPEQIRGKSTARSDVYGLGAILYWLLTGRPPFGGKTREEILQNVCVEDLQPPRSIEGRLDRDLDAVCRKCLEKEPDRRYDSAKALANDLQNWLDGQETSARKWSRPCRLWRWCKRKPVSAGLSATAALLVVAVTTVVILMFDARQAHLKTVEDDFRAAVETKSLEIASRFGRYEDLLEQLRGSAAILLTQVDPDDNIAITFAGDTLDPPDFANPSIVVAPTANHEMMKKTLPRFMQLRDVFKQTMFRSCGANMLQPRTDAEARRLLSKSGVPIAWVYVASEEGVDCTYPGIGGFPENYDPRDRPWYNAAKKSNGEVVWARPYADVLRRGRVISCSAPVYDQSGNFLGVAGFDLGEEFAKSEILKMAATDDFESFLVDSQGRVLISNVAGQPPTEVVAEIRKGEEGHLRTSTKLAAYFRVDVGDWYYVSVAELERMQDVWKTMRTPSIERE